MSKNGPETWFLWHFQFLVLLIHALIENIVDVALAVIIISTHTIDIHYSTARADATALSMAKALIVQNKGGGHGELGKTRF